VKRNGSLFYLWGVPRNIEDVCDETVGKVRVSGDFSLRINNLNLELVFDLRWRCAALQRACIKVGRMYNVLTDLRQVNLQDAIKLVGDAVFAALPFALQRVGAALVKRNDTLRIHRDAHVAGGRGNMQRKVGDTPLHDRADHRVVARVP